MPPKTINVVGFDPSLRNWGIAKGQVDLETLRVIKIETLSVIQPVRPTSKQVRNNSKDLEVAYQLSDGVLDAVLDAHVIFVEVPIGSQSARAMASYGICVGILGALRAAGMSFFEVTPTEVKLAGPGKKNASKKEMIQWATSQHPEANWPTYKRNGQTFITEDKAEHLADAVAAIYAGVRTNAFHQLLPFFQNQ